MNRNLKRWIVRAFNPLDHAARIINGKSHLPPLHLRWEVGPLRAFESDAAEFRVYLKEFAGFVPGSRILDIGCGCGQMALELADWLGYDGRYFGCDASAEAIRWCRRSIAAHDARFSFFPMDVRNGLYNPRGQFSASTYKFPAEWVNFDVILVKSVFTHMLREDVDNYLAQLPHLLSEHGRALVTFFLLNDGQRSLEHEKRNGIHFISGGDGIAFANPDAPEQIVAYDEDRIVNMMRRHGLDIEEPVHYGTWSGRMDRVSYQDILVLHRHPSAG